MPVLLHWVDAENIPEYLGGGSGWGWGAGQGGAACRVRLAWALQRGWLGLRRLRHLPSWPAWRP